MKVTHKFKVGCIYAIGYYVETGKPFTRSGMYVGSASTIQIAKFEVIARTAKTVTLKDVDEDDLDEVYHKKIYIDKDGNEFVYPLNTYGEKDWASVVKAEYLIKDHQWHICAKANCQSVDKNGCLYAINECTILKVAENGEIVITETSDKNNAVDSIETVNAEEYVVSTDAMEVAIQTEIDNAAKAEAATCKLVTKVNISNSFTPSALSDTNIATTLGNKLGALQNTLANSEYRRVAYFWEKYAYTATAIDTKYNSTVYGGVCSSKGEIKFNLDKDTKCNFVVLIHEVSHAIDDAFSEGLGLCLANSTLEIGGENITIQTALAADNALMKAAYKKAGISRAEYKDDLKASFFPSSGYGYNLPLMAINGSKEYNEFFAEFITYAICDSKHYSAVKALLPNTFRFFEALIKCLTPEFVEVKVRAKIRQNKRGGYVISFNNKYTLNQMMTFLQANKGLTFGQSAALLFGALKTAYPSQFDSLKLVVSDYNNLKWQFDAVIDAAISKIAA